MRIIYIFALLFVGLYGFAQEKLTLNHDTYDLWKSIKNQEISHDGKSVLYDLNPGNGDGHVVIYQKDLRIQDSIARGKQASFCQGFPYVVSKIAPPYRDVRKAKVDKKKEEQMPKDSLVIFSLTERKALKKYMRVKNYYVSRDYSPFVAILFEKDTAKVKPKTETKTELETKDSTKVVEKPKVKEKKKKKNLDDSGTDCIFYSFVKNDSLYFPKVNHVSVCKDGSKAVFIQQMGDSIDSAKVFIYDSKTHSSKPIFENAGFAKKAVLSNDGNHCAFLFSQDTSKAKVYSLFYYNFKNPPILVTDTQTLAIPMGWSPSENANVYFSDDNKKLLFGTAPKPIDEPKDTVPDDEKVKLDLWTWNESQIQPQQLKNLDKDKKETYLCVYHIDLEKVVQLGDTSYKYLSLLPKAQGNIALAMETEPYEIQSTWDSPSLKNYYIINLLSGTRTQIAKGTQNSYILSPEGKYYYWYNYSDSAWYVSPVGGHNPLCLTCGISFPFYDEQHDTPEPPDSYGAMGWLAGERYLLVYDRYDIWKLDAQGKDKPVCITAFHGRKTTNRTFYINLDKEAIYIPEKAWVRLENEETSKEGFYLANFKTATMPSLLIEKDAMMNFHAKAKNSDSYLWSYESFNTYPDLYVSTSKCVDSTRISFANPQQSKYYWGNVQKVTWNSYNGKKMKGLIYTPENFDPKQKYPMLVYFYERNSQQYHAHYIPRPSRSVINFPTYLSNQYVIFIPDIVYGVGNPGQDAYDCIISGVKTITNQYSWIDTTKMALQGQSWGGYQVAYLITKTKKMFAAAMAGAPVSNMTSAYGGIRWESGIGRMFQYEKSQSRIGYTLWDSLDLYIKNSPLFSVNQIETPLLIMSNDNDGAVPWYQGIELYMAMRRFQKPAWLLVYNKEDHNLTKRPNTIDLSIRMQQFFDHYLKGKPAPAWMINGIPALVKGKELRY